MASLKCDSRGQFFIISLIVIISKNPMTILHMHVSVIPTRGYSFKIKPAFSDSMRQVGGKKHQETEKCTERMKEGERACEKKRTWKDTRESASSH